MSQEQAAQLAARLANNDVAIANLNEQNDALRAQMAAMQNNLAQLTTTVQQMGQTEENVIAPLRDRCAKLEEALLQRGIPIKVEPVLNAAIGTAINAAIQAKDERFAVKDTAAKLAAKHLLTKCGVDPSFDVASALSEEGLCKLLTAIAHRLKFDSIPFIFDAKKQIAESFFASNTILIEVLEAALNDTTDPVYQLLVPGFHAEACADAKKALIVNLKNALLWVKKTHDTIRVQLGKQRIRPTPADAMTISQTLLQEATTKAAQKPVAALCGALDWTAACAATQFQSTAAGAAHTLVSSWEIERGEWRGKGQGKGDHTPTRTLPNKPPQPSEEDKKKFISIVASMPRKLDHASERPLCARVIGKWQPRANEGSTYLPKGTPGKDADWYLFQDKFPRPNKRQARALQNPKNKEEDTINSDEI